jgi:hypothetical protein
MDPSEFEGTIERRDVVLNAGALEDLLGLKSEPKVKPIDFNNETNEIYMSI